MDKLAQKVYQDKLAELDLLVDAALNAEAKFEDAYYA